MDKKRGKRGNHRSVQTQLIYVPHNDTIRLLEVYVKRSLSLNESTLHQVNPRRKEKWVTLPRNHRRHSSDPALHFAKELNFEEIGKFSAIDSQASLVEITHYEPKKPKKKSKKKKKPSFWKSFLGIFSQKSFDETDEEDDGPQESAEVAQAEGTSDSLTPSLPNTSISSQKKKKKSIKRRFSKRHLSLTKINKSVKELNSADITRVDGEFLGLDIFCFGLCKKGKQIQFYQNKRTNLSHSIVLHGAFAEDLPKICAFQRLSALSRRTLTMRRCRKNWKESSMRLKRTRKQNRSLMVRNSSFRQQ